VFDRIQGCIHFKQGAGRMSGSGSGRILVVPTSEVRHLGDFQGFRAGADRYLKALLVPGIAQFQPRGAMEEDPSFKQIIPYVIFRCGEAVFSYTRGRSQGEARLHSLRSIGVGGHVDEEDADGRATLDAYEIALRREIDEEVDVRSNGRISCVGLINDDATPVGSVHLGVVHVYELESPLVDPREEGLAEARFCSIRELVESSDQFESWSRFCIERLLHDHVS
jgi:predicted NUDIX family phosphoesterase